MYSFEFEPVILNVIFLFHLPIISMSSHTLLLLPLMLLLHTIHDYKGKLISKQRYRGIKKNEFRLNNKIYA